MSTRSFIGIESAEGSISSVYCHSDGYLEHTGKVLIENYKTAEQVQELLSFGDMSILRETIEQTEFYARDRGEEKSPPNFAEMREEYIDHANESYVYLFSNEEKWLVSLSGKAFTPLTHSIVRRRGFNDKNI